MLLWVGHYENEHFSFALNILFRFRLSTLLFVVLKHHCILNIISFTLLRNGPMYYVFKWRIPFFVALLRLANDISELRHLVLEKWNFTFIYSICQRNQNMFWIIIILSWKQHSIYIPSQWHTQNENLHRKLNLTLFSQNGGGFSSRFSFFFCSTV